MKQLVAITLSFVLSACAGGPVVQPEDTPTMYKPVSSETSSDCASLFDEVSDIDIKLGESVSETPIPSPPSTWQKIGSYAKNVSVQTILGPIQPVIQTARAVMGSETKEKNAALGRERALIRRAYLLGAMDANGCGILIEPPEPNL